MKELRKYYRIKGSPEEIYAALINPFAISLWTGAEAKMKDLNANSIEAAMQIILGSARSMGIEVK